MQKNILYAKKEAISEMDMASLILLKYINSPEPDLLVF